MCIQQHHRLFNSSGSPNLHGPNKPWAHVTLSVVGVEVDQMIQTLVIRHHGYYHQLTYPKSLDILLLPPTMLPREHLTMIIPVGRDSKVNNTKSISFYQVGNFFFNWEPFTIYLFLTFYVVRERNITIFVNLRHSLVSN